jgi:histone H3/H4
MNILTSKTIDKGNSQKDITIIRKMFDSLGIEEYEKNTLNYMSEFINSYIIDILKESKKNMILSKREKINIEDVELAVKTKQNLMYINRPPVQKMRELAEKVNSVPLPLIPETPNVLMPPLENNLLRNNFQIYSEELNRALLDEENKNILESTSLRPDDINMLGNKRKLNIGTESKNNLNFDNKLGKKRRKISLNQAFKKTSQENAKKENMMNLNETNNNIKINLNETKKSNLNSINNDDNGDDIDFDNDIDNNNNGDSTNNHIKDEEDEDLKMEDEDNGDDDVEGEEMEGDNDNDNESINEGNESNSDKEDEKNDKKKNDDNNMKYIHEDDEEEDDF